MQDEVRTRLEQAYRLIKRDQTGEAQELLRTVLDSDAGNVHAWWLLAHAASDPDEIRYALNQVLTLQPDYPHAAKVRELLAALDERFPSLEDLEALDEQGAPLLDGAELVSEGLVHPGESPDWRDELRESAEEESLAFAGRVEPPDDEPSDLAAVAAAEDPFGDLDASFLADMDTGDAGDEIVFPLAQEEDEAELPDLDTLFELETDASEAITRPAPGRSSRSRLVRWLVLPALLILVIVVVWVLWLRPSEDGTGDLEPLVASTIDDPGLQDLLRNLETELRQRSLGGNPRALVVEGDAGRTLYAEFCAQPTVEMPEKVFQGIALVSDYAQMAGDSVEAIGLSIMTCGEDHPDTLYRAATPVANALRYASGELGEGEIALARYHALWSSR